MSSSDDQAGNQGIERYGTNSNSSAVVAAAAFTGLSSISSNITDLMKHKSEHERVTTKSGITKTGFTLFDNSTTINVHQDGLSGIQAASIGVVAAAATVAVGVGIHHLCNKKDREERTSFPVPGHAHPASISRTGRMTDVDEMMLRYEGRSA